MFLANFSVWTRKPHSATRDALASKGLDLLGQQLALLVAVSQAAPASKAAAPGGAVGSDGEAVWLSSDRGLELALLTCTVITVVRTAVFSPASPGPVYTGRSNACTTPGWRRESGSVTSCVWFTSGWQSKHADRTLLPVAGRQKAPEWLIPILAYNDQM